MTVLPTRWLTVHKANFTTQWRLRLHHNHLHRRRPTSCGRCRSNTWPRTKKAETCSRGTWRTWWIRSTRNATSSTFCARDCGFRKTSRALRWKHSSGEYFIAMWKNSSWRCHKNSRATLIRCCKGRTSSSGPNCSTRWSSRSWKSSTRLLTRASCNRPNTWIDCSTTEVPLETVLPTSLITQT